MARETRIHVCIVKKINNASKLIVEQWFYGLVPIDALNTRAIALKRTIEYFIYVRLDELPFDKGNRLVVTKIRKEKNKKKYNKNPEIILWEPYDIKEIYPMYLYDAILNKEVIGIMWDDNHKEIVYNVEQSALTDYVDQFLINECIMKPILDK